MLGYKRAMKQAKAGLNTRWVQSGDFSLASGYACMQTLLELPDRPTALFCSNDEMAIGAMQACREACLNLPADMSIVGFDDIPFAAYTHPRLSSVHQPRNQIGEQVMLLMLRMLRDGATEQARIVLPHKLVVRDSTAPLRAF
ncbi:MAG: LacI family repressor for deo operon, udp, cdd, tsx, nupC, and nupG [Paracoccaceae bacterium]